MELVSVVVMVCDEVFVLEVSLLSLTVELEVLVLEQPTNNEAINIRTASAAAVSRLSLISSLPVLL